MQMSLTKQVSEAKNNQATECAPKPSFEINSFKFRETCALEWQHIDYDFSSGVSEHTKAAVNAITYPHHKGVSPCS